MRKEDLIIQSQVRGILVRTNVVASKIRFGTVRGIFYFRGLFTVTRVNLRGDDSKDLTFKTRDFAVKILSSFEKKGKALRINPPYLVARICLEGLCGGQKNPKAARREERKVLEIDPGDEFAARGLRQRRSEGGRGHRAVAGPAKVLYPRS